MKFHYRKHKIRFDRGRMWYSSFQSIFTAILVAVFVSEGSIISKILFASSIFVLIYILGFVDDKLKLLEKEQSEYFKRNPLLEKMASDIKEIKNKIK